MSTPAVRAAHCALALSLVVSAGCRKEESRSGGPGVVPHAVEVVSVGPQRFRETLFATGSLRARESVTLKAERSGVVNDVRFEEGKPVAAGEVLVVIDDSELQAQLDSARAQLELATANERRDRELLRNNMLISQAAYDQSLANLHVAEAAARLIEAQLTKTRIVAPFDGIAGLRQVSVGAYLTPGAAIGSFQDIGALKLDFTLPERYLANLRSARTVNIRVAGASEPIEGRIYAIEPTIDVATRSVQVRAIVPNREQLLLPGAFAEVEVVLGEIPDAILIPAIALVPGVKEQRVFVHRDGLVEERRVETGLRTADGVHVVRGLQAGDEVIVSGVLQLRPGTKVRVRPAHDAGVAIPASRTDRRTDGPGGSP